MSSQTVTFSGDLDWIPDFNVDQYLNLPDDSPEDSRIRKYDVFLSFRGEDTRKSFTSHLFASLQNAGIIVFKDDHSLVRGDDISKSLLQAIQESRISVIVFSKNYADSRWCLQELMKIMECNRTTGQMLLPVFYDVHPSEVRHQTGEFGKVFRNLSKRILKGDELMVPKWRNTLEEEESMVLEDGYKDIVLKWKDALHEAAGLAGFLVLNSRLPTSSLHFNNFLLLCF